MILKLTRKIAWEVQFEYIISYLSDVEQEIYVMFYLMILLNVYVMF